MHRLLDVCTACAVTVGMALLLAGCSSDSKSTNPNTNTLTEQQQYDLLDSFIDLNFDSESSDPFMVDVLTLGLGQVNGQFLDGVTESDITNNGIFIPGLGKRVFPGQLQSSFSLSYSNGWWVITADSAFADQSGSFSWSVLDSVRFETIAGLPQEVPDPSTATFIERGRITATGGFAANNIMADLDMALHSAVVISNLTTSTAVLNSNSDGSIAFGLDSPDGAVDLSLDFAGATTGFTVPNYDQGNDCPSSGSMAINLGAEINAVSDTEEAHAQADWDVSVNINEGGTATIMAQSGNLSRSATGPICDGSVASHGPIPGWLEPPLE